MGSAAVQIVCVALGVIGLILGIVCCAVPRWKVSSFVGSSIVTAQSVQEGLWMNCVSQSTGQQQCKTYDPLLALPSDLQAARAMVIISITITGLTLLILFVRDSSCVANEDAKAKISLVAGIGMILAGLLIIIPVNWTAHTIIRNFNSPLTVGAQKREVGACIFIGWAGGALIILAGGLLCCFRRPKSGSSGGTAKYSSASA